MAPVTIGAVVDSPKISAPGNPGGLPAYYKEPKHIANFICDIVFSGCLVARNQPLLDGSIVRCENRSVLIGSPTDR